MNKEDRRILLRNRLVLVKDVEANDLIGFLYQDGIISENDKDTIEWHKTRRERIEYLLDLLPRKGPKAFRGFCEILYKSDRYRYLAEILIPSICSIEDAVDAGGPSVPLPITSSPSITLARPTRESKPVIDMLNVYPITSTSHGLCFIINNMHFSKLADRRGSQRDARKLQELFNSLAYTVWLVNDADAAEIRSKFQELASKTNHSDCLVVCILSHGLTGKIYGVDGELVPISEILDIINSGPMATLLKGKPKLFLIQACRKPEAKKVTENTTIHDSSQIISSAKQGVSGDNSSSESAYTSFIDESTVHTHSDLLLSYSTFPGEISWRHTAKGSYFIDSVIEIFSEYSSSEDVLSMLVKVNENILKKLSKDGIEQIPAPVFTLTKRFYLVPPP